MATGTVTGIDKLVMWELTADTSSAITYGTEATEFLKKLMTRTDTPATAQAQLDACNQTVDQFVAINGGELSIGVTDLDSTERALIFGETADASGVNVNAKDDRPNYLCVAYMTTRSDGKVNLYKYPKVMFMPQAETAETQKKGAVTYQTITVKGNYIPTIKDGSARYVKYGVDPAADASLVTTWFSDAAATAVTEG